MSNLFVLSGTTFCPSVVKKNVWNAGGIECEENLKSIDKIDWYTLFHQIRKHMLSK